MTDNIGNITQVRRRVMFTFVFVQYLSSQFLFLIMAPSTSNDPLHGKTLQMILTHLVEMYGWEELGKIIPVNCFKTNPSINSSLKFLRKTPWARKKVEELYING